MDFKVGDKVRLKNCKRVREILCIDGAEVWLRCNDADLADDEHRVTWELDDIAGKVEPLPTPPEGREVEAEMRQPKRDDMYWLTSVEEPGWVLARGDHVPPMDGPHYCLRPLPPKPEGEGWEWRRPVIGDETQSLHTDGSVGDVVMAASVILNHETRLGYRWCRAKPKVKRWNGPLLMDDAPIIDDNTGPRLDKDKIGREWAIKWLEGQLDYGSAKHFAEMIRKELEANNERD